MDHRIGRLHHRYRAPVAAAARLDRLAAARLPDALDRALASALGDDPAVYVFRRVVARFSLRLDDAEADDALASAWAARLARTIVRAIDDDAGQGGLVRFDDRAAYAAAFAVDLLTDRAADRWYYAPFAPLLDLPVADALARLLLEHRDVLPALLARLHRSGRLARAIAVVAPDDRRSIWDAARGLESVPVPDSSRPLFALAARLLDRLGLLSPSETIDSLWHQYRVTSPDDPDWRDAGSLALGVVDALRFLLDRATAPVPDPTPDRIEAALADLDADWLDRGLIARSFPRPRDAEMTAAIAGRGPSPSRRLLLEEIRAAIVEVLPTLDPGPLDAPANALLILAALIDRHPDRATDPGASATIATLLAASSALSRADSPVDSLESLRRGQIAPTAPLRAFASLGQTGIEIVATLLARASPSGRRGDDPPTIVTGCAGLFFLIRAVLDLRLASLHRAGDGDDISEFADFSTFLAALARRWSGLADDDPGLAIFAGLGLASVGSAVRTTSPPAARAEEVRTADPTDRPSAAIDGLQAALLRQLVGLRMIDGSALTAHVDRGADGVIRLVAGDPVAGLWPLGRAIDDAAEIPRALDDWSALIDANIGSTPAWTVADETPASWTAAVASIEGDDPSRTDADLTLTLVAIAAVRAWSRWLVRLSGSSVGYVLTNFLRRPGRLRVGASSIEVEYEARPLDVVLEMAGYRATIDAVPWLGGRRVTFRAIER